MRENAKKLLLDLRHAHVMTHEAFSGERKVTLDYLDVSSATESLAVGHKKSRTYAMSPVLAGLIEEERIQEIHHTLKKCGKELEKNGVKAILRVGDSFNRAGVPEDTPPVRKFLITLNTASTAKSSLALEIAKAWNTTPIFGGSYEEVYRPKEKTSFLQKIRKWLEKR